MANNLLKVNPFRWSLLIAVGVFINLHRVIMNYWLGIDLVISAIDSAVHTILLAGAVALVAQTLAFYRPMKGKYSFVAIFTGAVSLVWAGVVICILRSIYSDNLLYVQWLSDTTPIRFALGWTVITGTGFIAFFTYEMQEQQEALARKEAAEKLAREAELYKLRQQLQPHFLFNSLNSINALVSIRPEEAREMIQKLSDFLRGTLKKEDQLWIPLKEELQYLRLYLDIEKVRFRHRLTTDIVEEDGMQHMQIPPMLLQPVVENAIKFGLYDTTEAININIRASQENGLLKVSVSNPFDPALQHQPSLGTGFGLNSIRRRLYLLFARQDLLETHIDGQLFTTIIKVPQLHDKSSSDR
ncbi:sensor histidine kinase [Chitinophaga sp. XS-30]|uniref:sensor histidine kinase n=1 Tax=Chitinophaga sp. XS-30 TaxID=2604421 RepID=UPI001FEE6672|nr:histidine kinase [Chitinophaga sp. XS-30]